MHEEHSPRPAKDHDRSANLPVDAPDGLRRGMNQDCERETVKAFWGELIDCSGERWRLSATHELDFTNFCGGIEYIHQTLSTHGIRDALEAYLKYMIKNTQAVSVHMAHHIIMKMLRDKIILLSLQDPAPVLLDTIFSQLRQRMEVDQVRRHITTFRTFYCWAAERADEKGWEGFHEMTGLRLRGTIIKGARIGRAVLRADPHEGPLSHAEYASVLDAVRKAALDPTADIGETAAAALFVAFGCNPENLRDLEEGDLLDPIAPGGLHRLLIPRIKKRKQRKRRDAFVEREAGPELAELVRRLIARNQRWAPPDPERDGQSGRPLFRREEPSRLYLARGFARAAIMVGHGWWRTALDRLVARYELVDDFGERMRLLPRRLRYTFVAREVARGTRPDDLMRMMDHSDLATILAYYAARLDIVTRIDQAVGDALAPLARMFLGQERPGDRYELPGLPEDWRAALDLDLAPYACLGCPEWRPTNGARLDAMARTLMGTSDALRVPGAPVNRCAELEALAVAAEKAADACGRTAWFGRSRPPDNDLDRPVRMAGPMPRLKRPD